MKTTLTLFFIIFLGYNSFAQILERPRKYRQTLLIRDKQIVDTSYNKKLKNIYEGKILSLPNVGEASFSDISAIPVQGDSTIMDSVPPITPSLPASEISVINREVSKPSPKSDINGIGDIVIPSEAKPITEVLQQLGLNVNKSIPRVNIKALRFDAEIGKQIFDFYLLASLPTGGTNPVDSARNLGFELQNMYGGLVNTYFNKLWQGDNSENKGLKFDLRAGYKLAESGVNNTYFHTAQLGSELKFLIPLKTRTPIKDMAGVFQLRIGGQALGILDSPDFASFYRDPVSLKAPSSVMFSGTIEASLHVKNAFYVTLSRSGSSTPGMTPLTNFSITYSKP